MLRRSTLGLLASGAVLFLAGASGAVGTWALVSGTLLLTMTSVLFAVAADAPTPVASRPLLWGPDGGTPVVGTLEQAA